MPLELIEVGAQVPLNKMNESAQKFRMTTEGPPLDQLAASMKAHGQIHAISLLDEGDGVYEVINGHRRFDAASRSGLPSLRSNIYRIPDNEVANKDVLIQQHLYAANMAEPLVPLERARMFDALMQEFDFDVAKVADLFEGETAETVADTLKFLAIDQTVIDVITANPEKFSEAHVRVLAEYASPATKHAWRMKPQEQLTVAREIADQTDKQMVKDPRKLETRIRHVVKERRQAESAKRATTTKGQTDPVKALFKAIESAESAVRGLREFDVASIDSIDAGDKGDGIKRVFDLIEQLQAFNDDRLSKVAIRKAAS